MLTHLVADLRHHMFYTTDDREQPLTLQSATYTAALLNGLMPEGFKDFAVCQVIRAPEVTTDIHGSFEKAALYLATGR